MDRPSPAPGYEAEPGVMKAACCHHRRHAGHGACGACYARVIDALDAIEAHPGNAAAIVQHTHTMMQADRPLPKRPKRGEHYWLSYGQMRLHWPNIAGKDPAKYAPSCLWCGAMKRNDGKAQAPCRGRVRIELRRALGAKEG